MSQADVSDACRNVWVDPDRAHNICYTVGDLVVIVFSINLRMVGVAGFWGVLSAAAEHAHCNPTLNSTHLFD